MERLLADVRVGDVARHEDEARANPCQRGDHAGEQDGVPRQGRAFAHPSHGDTICRIRVLADFCEDSRVTCNGIATLAVRLIMRTAAPSVR